MGQRLSELCSKGPYLEEDIAISNIALDYLGQANSLYEYASTLINNEKNIDELAFRRDERSFYNLLLVEQDNGHFGDTVCKIFLFSAYQYVFYNKLIDSTDSQLSAIAEKSLKEVKYHLRHSKSWIIRLGDGTDESKNKIQDSINNFWKFTGEFFEIDTIDNNLLANNISVNCKTIESEWNLIVNECLEEATLNKPKDIFMKTGGRKGIHSEKLGFILAEMQFLQRSYPNAKW